MTSINAGKVTILSTVHQALDNRVFYREARTLARAGYQVTLIAVHDRNEEKDGVLIRALPRVPRSRRPVLWRAAAQIALETSADLFHVHDPELLLLTPSLRRKTGLPTIYDVHEANADFILVKDYLPKIIRRPLAGLIRRFEPWRAQRESGLIFADDAIAADFREFSGPKTTLFNFPDSELIKSGAPSVANASPRNPVVLYLGGLERNRGSGLMIAAFAQVVRKLPQARLLIVGHFMPPGLETEIRAAARAYGIDHALAITGRVPFARIGDYLSMAAVGWIPWQSYSKNRKNVPTKMFEYMAYGLPVVSSDLPSTAQFIEHGDSGLLVESGNAEAHAAALLDLLADPVTAVRMGQRGRRLVESKYNWDRMIPRLLQLYSQVLAGS